MRMCRQDAAVENRWPLDVRTLILHGMSQAGDDSLASLPAKKESSEQQYDTLIYSLYINRWIPMKELFELHRYD